MIERFWAKNFRMLASNRVDLDSFAVLVGRNASGKSTLMAALRFVSHVLSDGVDRAVEAALDGGGSTFRDLCFRPDQPIAFALTLRLLGELYRYELEVGPTETSPPVVLRENLFRIGDGEAGPQPSLFGNEMDLDPVVHPSAPKGWRKIVGKTAEGRDYFRDEKTDWNNVFLFGPKRSALGNIPEDPNRFPGAIAARNLLREGVMMVELDSHKLRLPSPPRAPSRLLRDGSNLGTAARALQQRDAVAFRQWVRHVGHAIEGLEDVDTWERPEDKHVVLRGRFRGGHVEPVPSWLLSDGTLRLMALSLLSYAEIDGEQGVYLVEEPENGLHPLAIQSVFQSLSAMRSTQVFVATHSPVFLASTSMDQALVFRRTEIGTSSIQRGAEVAELRHWKGQVRLADVFASGVLS
jgi:predicted ATPase